MNLGNKNDCRYQSGSTVNDVSRITTGKKQTVKKEEKKMQTLLVDSMGNLEVPV